MTTKPLDLSPLALATGASLAVHRLLEPHPTTAAFGRPLTVELMLSAWLEGAKDISARAAAMVDETKAEMRAAGILEESEPQRTDDQRAALEMLDIGNHCGVAASSGQPVRLGLLMPPTRQQALTPEQALVLAAWLVAMAEPWSPVKFVDVLHKVHNT